MRHFAQHLPAARDAGWIPSDPLAQPGVSGWDLLFVDVEVGILLELVLAANYLDVGHLMDLACAKRLDLTTGGSTPSNLSPKPCVSTCLSSSRLSAMRLNIAPVMCPASDSAA